MHRAQSGHLARTCLPHWCCRTVLPDGVILHHFLQKCFTKWCNFTCLCAEKFRAMPSKHWCNFKRFNTILNTVVKFCWILYAKWNIWKISFKCVFVFALATLNISSMVQCPPPNWKVGCSIDGHWVNRPQHFLVITVTAPTKSLYSGFSLPPIDVE